MTNVNKVKNGESFEDSMKKLQQLLAELEDPSLPLDCSIEKYGAAREKLSQCRKMLDDFELKVKTLSKNGEFDFPSKLAD